MVCVLIFFLFFNVVSFFQFGCNLMLHNRLWICLVLVYGMFGITIHTRKFLSEFLVKYIASCINHLMNIAYLTIVFHFGLRMSIEMVACIAIEAISILEKMHSRG